MWAAVQPLLAGGQHVTAWRERSTGRARTLYVHVAHSHPGTTALGRALKAVRGASPLPYSALALTHRAWWHAYYRKSFLSLPDARMQRFYWIQPLAGAHPLAQHLVEPQRPAGVLADPRLQPPRTRRDHPVAERVPGQPGQGDGAPYRADSLGIPRTTDPHLVNGADGPLTGYGVGIPGQEPPTPEVGNLTWALHNVWLSYRHTMDESILRDVLYPLLRKAINYYLHFLEPGPDGKLHLPATFSRSTAATHGTATTT
ncbi:hypothetical protein WKI71_34840 [Streptomyces sp. MS1.AVA.1]|uniref:Glycosyl hydrolase family 95 catalytic domain-containing protein n=1 Tax=Streptomyces machairae TaxID=3134109 RepID=A0ABU8URY3_9ACTN